MLYIIDPQNTFECFLGYNMHIVTILFLKHYTEQ